MPKIDVGRIAGSALACALLAACSHSSHSRSDANTAHSTSSSTPTSALGTTRPSSAATTAAPPITGSGSTVAVAMTSSEPTRRVTLRVGQELIVTTRTSDLSWVADTPPRALRVDPGSVCYATCTRPRRVFHGVAPGTAELDTVLRCPSLSLCPSGPSIVVTIVP